VDEYGLPVRYNWAADYRGKAKVVYGHTPVPDAEWFNGTICLDTGCVFGGRLTALRYPEMDLISVPARQVYYAPAKPLAAATTAGSAQQQHDDMIDLADVQGRRVIETTLMGRLTLREENATAALEAMSRFAVDPRWLIYLPPTMSPSETSQREGLLEHPEDAFAYFREHGATRVICEEKHMGSRAVAIVCRDGDVARKRFGIESAAGGVIYTRTGRPFFSDEAVEAALLARLRQAATRAGWWDKLNTSWFCLDAELMPWSAKAQALLQQQYAPVGLAAEMGLGAAVESLKAAAGRGVPLESLLHRVSARESLSHAYREAYRRYCWPVAVIDDLKLAPFHLLATENAAHTDKPHDWHMETLGELCDADPILMRTSHRLVDLANDAEVGEAIAWWEALTEKGGEGMVVKPIEFITRGSRHGLLQPALKCRGPEYLRIIYGLDYSAPENLERLRRRGLGRKRSLAQREFALGLTALDRFVRREPLRLVHECVFGILALESEPVDPRL
jgi:protein phosphatase